MPTDYTLLVNFTAVQRDHLDIQRAKGVPAAVYLRMLVNEDMAEKKGGALSETPHPLPQVGEPMAFTDSPPAHLCDGCGGTGTKHRVGCLRRLNPDYRGDRGPSYTDTPTSTHRAPTP